MPGSGNNVRKNPHSAEAPPQAGARAQRESRRAGGRLRKDARRTQLLDVAASLFAESSYGNVTTASLAKAAGVTEPVLYQHFQGKDDLYHALLRETCRRTLESWNAIVERAGSPLSGVVNICRDQFRLMSDQWVYYKLHVRAIAEASDEAVRGILCENDDAYHSYLCGLLDRAKKIGEIRAEIKVCDVAWFIMSQGLMLNVYRQIGNRKLEESGYIENLIRTTLAGVSVGAPIVVK